MYSVNLKENYVYMLNHCKEYCYFNIFLLSNHVMIEFKFRVCLHFSGFLRIDSRVLIYDLLLWLTIAWKEGGAVAQSVERATPGEEVPGSIPAVA